MRQDSVQIKPVEVKPQELKEDALLPPTPGHGVQATPYFVVTHNYSWGFHEEEPGQDEEGNAITLPPEWLPDVSYVKFQPGVNGIGEDRDPHTGKVTVRPALALGLASEKGIVIRPEDPRLGRFQYYVGRYELKGGGYFHCFKWLIFHRVNGGRAAVPDRPSNVTQTRAFYRHLYESGIVPLMSPEVLAGKIAVRRGGFAQMEALFRSGKVEADTFTLQQQKLDREIELWESCYRRLVEAPEAPTKRTKSQRVAPAPAPAPSEAT